MYAAEAECVQGAGARKGCGWVRMCVWREGLVRCHTNQLIESCEGRISDWSEASSNVLSSQHFSSTFSHGSSFSSSSGSVVKHCVVTV